ncbi:hypothetical protein U1701_00055 [Sphingomonas sp. PB2P19]|uniref:hypothetical protein n=1 Tax=Sphingomonas rhamnosi TaxID=3096156 RepID=UPI002FCABD6E
MSKNATPWPKMIRAVYDSFDTGRHQGDAIARRVMDRIVSWLTKGLDLSPRLQAKLIDNINMRTSYQVVDPGEPVRLTRNQLGYAVKTSPEWFTLGLDGEDEPAENVLKTPLNSATFQHDPDTFQQVFSNLSAGIQHSFSSLSALFPHEALALAQRLVSQAAENCGTGATYSLPQDPKVMEREENEVNHERSMILASPVLAGHDQEVAEVPSHEPQADNDEGHTQVDNHRGQGNEGKRRPALTLWIKPDARGDVNATGFFDRGDDKFALRFTRFDHALERIGAADQDWHGFANKTIGPDLLPGERSATGIAANATFSGLYGAQDTWARKNPLFANKAVALTWNGDEPDHAYLIEGQTITEVTLRRETNNRYKGLIQ